MGNMEPPLTGPQWSQYQYFDFFICCLFQNQSLAQSQSQKSFGGFKKGFLNNPKPKKGKSPSLSKPGKKDDIPVIKAKNPEQKNKGMEIPEVQEAMKSNLPSLENKGDQVKSKL